MKLQQVLGAVALAGMTLAVGGGEVFRSRFGEEDGAWRHVFYQRLDAQPGSIEEHGGENRAVIATPDFWSWAFLVKVFEPAELPGAQVRVSAWVRGNGAPVELVISEGFVWGDFSPEFKIESRQTTDQWQRLTVQYTRTRRDVQMSVAAGLNYANANAYVEVAGLTVECADQLAELPLVPPPDALDFTTRIWQSLSSKLAAAETMAAQTADAATAAYLASFRTDDARQAPLPVAVYGELAKRIADVLAREWLLAVQPSLQDFRAETALDPVQDAPGFELVAAANETESQLLLMRNNAGSSRLLQWRVTGDEALRSALTLRALHYIESSPDYTVPVAPDTPLLLAGGETAGWLLEVDAAKLLPGRYTGALVLTPTQKHLAERTIPIAVEVLEVELPETPLWVGNWDFSQSADPRIMSFLMEAGVNMIHVSRLPLPGEHDFSAFRELVRQTRQANGERPVHFFLEVWFARDNHGWKPEYNAWLDELVAAAEAEGLGYHNWSLHLYDETLSDEFYETAKAVKAHNAKIKIFSDLLPPEVEKVERFAEVVDFWCPLVRSLELPEYQEALAAMRRSGHPIWVYECDSNPTHPLAEYRLLPYQAWRYGCEGVSFWMAPPCSFRGPDNGVNFGINYRAAAGDYLPSRRWLQWKEGLEDYRLLALATAAGEEAAARQYADAAVKQRADAAWAATVERGRHALLRILAARP